MSLAPLADPGPDPALLAQLQSSAAPKAVRQRASFFVFFANTVYPELAKQRPALAGLYKARHGRPAQEPVRLLGMLLLQFVERYPDRQAAEAMQYDLRWRVALHLQPGEAACDPSLLAVFRQRLLTGGCERRGFEAALALLTAAGWVRQHTPQRLDSTHVCGLVSEMSRLECGRETLRLVLVAVAERAVLPPAWPPLWDRYVEGKLAPRHTVETYQAKVREAGEDMHLILTWAAAQGAPWAAAKEVQLLRRVFDENYAVDATGQRQQTPAQPPGAVHNPHDPQAQWSTKSTIKAKAWVGYKVQVAETVQPGPLTPGEPTRNAITAIVTQPAIASDKPGLVAVLAAQASLGVAPPSTLYGDGAYISGPALKEAHDQGRELRGPAPASPDGGKGFTVEAFTVAIVTRTATCPAGQPTTQCSRLAEAKTGKVSYRFEWHATLCGACPQRAQCVGATQSHRTLTVGEHHDFLQARRREMLTETFRTEMHRRNGIEGTQSELVRAYGLRHARYRGLAKVTLQNYMIGAACNLRRLCRRLLWEAAQTLKAELTTVGAVLQ
jgi:transposase